MKEEEIPAEVAELVELVERIEARADEPEAMPAKIVDPLDPAHNLGASAREILQNTLILCDQDRRREAAWLRNWLNLTRANRDWITAHLVELYGSAESRKPKLPARPKLPRLTAESRDKYLAAVARGIGNGSISAPEGRALLYAAQVSVGDQKAAPRRDGRDIVDLSAEAAGQTPTLSASEIEAEAGLQLRTRAGRR